MFKKLKEKSYPEIKVVVKVFEHVETGALHYHTEYDTVHNAFSLHFKTLPQKANGVAHILEHSVLNGSEKYPVPGMFLKLSGRNFESQLNAVTKQDSTQYYFSAIDNTGFMNLLDVYLDATFFPLLKKEVFLQEGWSYKLSDPNNIHSSLQYSGVVLNEMKGAFSNSGFALLQEMLQKTSSGSIYANVSGGLPQEITDLTYEEFLAFHKENYHPSNATFFTYGSVPVEEIHAKFENNVLNKFTKKEIAQDNTKITPYAGQKHIGSHPGQSGVRYIKGFELPKFNSLEEKYLVDILLGVLNSGEHQLNNFFMQENIGVFSADLMTLPLGETPFIYFSFNMEENASEKVEKSLENYFSDIIQKDVSHETIDNLFDLIEIQVRQGQEASTNMGLVTINKYLQILGLGIDNPEGCHDISMIKNLKDKIKQPDFLKNLIIKMFVENKKTVNYTSFADPAYSMKILEDEQKKLKAKESQISLSERQEILEQMISLKKYQEKVVSNNLPKLNLKDIVVQYPSKEEFYEIDYGGLVVGMFERNTNGLYYNALHFPMIVSSMEDLYTTKLAVYLANNLNLKDKTLEETSSWKESSIQNLDISEKVVRNKDGFEGYYVLNSCGLSENVETIIEKELYFVNNISFEDKEYIAHLILDLWNSHTSSLNSQVFQIVQSEAVSNLSTYNKFLKSYNNDFYNDYLKYIVKMIENNDFSFISSLESAFNKVFENTPKVFLCSDLQTSEKSLQLFETKLLNLNNNVSNVDKLIFNIEEKQKNKVIDLELSVNYICATSPAENISSPDAGKLSVLANFLDTYLTSKIREQGGAYSAGAKYDPDGSFTLYSYQDPNTVKTLEVFARVKDYLLSNPINEDLLEVAKLTIIQGVNQPKTLIQKALAEWSRYLGKSEEYYRKQYIDSVLNTTANDLKEMVEKYFISENVNVVIATNKNTIEENFLTWEKVDVLGNNKLSKSLKI